MPIRAGECRLAVPRVERALDVDRGSLAGTPRSFTGGHDGRTLVVVVGRGGALGAPPGPGSEDAGHLTPRRVQAVQPRRCVPALQLRLPAPAPRRRALDAAMPRLWRAYIFNSLTWGRWHLCRARLFRRRNSRGRAPRRLLTVATRRRSAGEKSERFEPVWERRASAPWCCACFWRRSRPLRRARRASTRPRHARRHARRL